MEDINAIISIGGYRMCEILVFILSADLQKYRG